MSQFGDLIVMDVNESGKGVSVERDKILFHGFTSFLLFGFPPLENFAVFSIQQCFFLRKDL